MKNISFAYTALALAAALALGACGGGGGGGDKKTAETASAGGAPAAVSEETGRELAENAKQLRKAEQDLTALAQKQEDRKAERGRIADRNSAEFQTLNTQIAILQNRMDVVKKKADILRQTNDEKKKVLRG